MAPRRADRDDRAWDSERERFVAAVRETLAEQRQAIADEREAEADARERAMDTRESGIDLWEDEHGRFSPEAANARQAERQLRIEAAARRAKAGELRDTAAKRRPASERWALGGDLARQFAVLAAEFYSDDTLDGVLRRITDGAVMMIGACDAASVTFAHLGRFWTPSATDPLAEEIDALQYRMEEGPCIEATQAPLSETSGGWERWPRLAESASVLPIECVLSCRVATGEARREPEAAALNLYSFQHEGFDQAERQAAVILAAHASVAVAVAKERQAVGQAEETFRQALVSRQVIGQATGMLMERQRLSGDEAFDILRRASQRMNVKVRDVAANLASGRVVVDHGKRPDFDQLGRVLDEMLDRAHTIPPHELPLLANDVAERVGVVSTTVFLADFGQRRLIPFTDRPTVEAFDIDGTLGGRAFIQGEPVELLHDHGVTLWVPLVDGVERLGVVHFELDRIDDDRRGTLTKVAALLAAETVSRGQYSDAVTLTRRTREMTLAAELQWRLMPPQAVTTRGVKVAAALEPSYVVAGDAYDYACNDTLLHLAVVDAIGHDLHATLVSGLAVGAYRHARRRHLDLARSAEEMEAALQQQFGGETFATAVLAELDTSSGELAYINAGHPPPLLLRQGRIVGPLDTSHRLPVGIGHINPATAAIGRTRLQPQDRVLFYTDGMIEARSATGKGFGLERLEAFIRRHLTDGRSDPEILRRLMHSVVDHHHGRLDDDATMVMVYWDPTAEE